MSKGGTNGYHSPLAGKHISGSFNKPPRAPRGPKSKGCAVVVLAGLATSVILATILGHVVGAA